MEPRLPLGRVIGVRRHDRNLTLGQLAEQVHVNKSTILRLERGEVVAPSPDLLVALAKALEVSAGELFTLAGYPTVGHQPDLATCLRSQYGSLPETVVAHIEGYLEGYLSKYR